MPPTEGEHSGAVLLVPPTREGWESVQEPVPCIVGGYFRQSSPYVSYYHVDSPYLGVHYPELATQFGISWEWAEDDGFGFYGMRPIEEGDVPAEYGEFKFFKPTGKKQKKLTHKKQPELSSTVPASISARIDNFTLHPLVHIKLTSPTEMQKRAQDVLQSQLAACSTRLLYEFMHKCALNNLGAIGIKMRAALRASLPRTHKAKAKTEDLSYEPFVASVSHDMEPDVAGVIKALLAAAGFLKDANEYKPASESCINELFGAETTRGMFNPLLRMFFFPARAVLNHRLFPSAAPSSITDPTGASDTSLYAAAAAELKGNEQDSEGKLLPAYMLRKRIVDKWQLGIVPDWRVRAIAQVRTDRYTEFVVTFKTKIKKIEGADSASMTTMKVDFLWSGRHREEPGKTHMRDIFKSL